jgi:hypothetical protein
MSQSLATNNKGFRHFTMIAGRSVQHGRDMGKGKPSAIDAGGGAAGRDRRCLD